MPEEDKNKGWNKLLNSDEPIYELSSASTQEPITSKDVLDVMEKLDELQSSPLKTNKDFVDYVAESISNESNDKMESLLIEGLKRKGFEFENRIELETFIKSNCRCEDLPDIKQRTYFANDIPFFLHCYDTELDIIEIKSDREISITANLGNYAFL